LLGDLAAAYQSVVTDVPHDLDPVPVSYRRWAQQILVTAADPLLASELQHWTRTLADAPELFASGGTGAAGSAGAATAHLRQRISPDITQPLLHEVTRAFSAEPLDVLMTALSLGIREWTGTDSGPVLVDVESHGRYPVTSGLDVTRTVGWFTHLYPVRVDPGPRPALDRALKTVKEQLRAVPGSGLGYGLLRYLNPRTADLLAPLAEPQIALNYLGHGAKFPDGEWGPAPEADLLTGLDVDPRMRLPHAIALNVAVEDAQEGSSFTVTWAFQPDLVGHDEVRRLADQFFSALQALSGLGHSGGHTPSDLDLVDLTQDEIEEFEAGLDAW
jgi:non-ribosomal peptide synthase protein (TIGR01720 family)